MESEAEIIINTIKSLRKVIIFISIDNNSLQNKLLNGLSAKELEPTEILIMKSALILNITEIDKDGIYKWNKDIAELVSHELKWATFINILKHQISYLNILLNPSKTELNGPLRQSENNPEEYIRFLKGVDSSHTYHAEWFASNPFFLNSIRLIDIGGGMGTFSFAWVNQNVHRSSILIDLPRLSYLFTNPSSKLKFIGADLEKGLDFKNIEGDIYLFANVLHLLNNWKELIDQCFESMQSGKLLVIFEATSEDEPGTLFNYQVHMRSGFKTFLIPFDIINEKLISLNCVSIIENAILDPSDPFQRTYKLWICQKQ